MCEFKPGDLIKYHVNPLCKGPLAYEHGMVLRVFHRPTDDGFDLNRARDRDGYRGGDFTCFPMLDIMWFSPKIQDLNKNQNYGAWSDYKNAQDLVSKWEPEK